MTWRELRRAIEQAGGERLRGGRGSREVWRVRGRTITIQTRHLNEQVSRSVEQRLLGALEQPE